MCHRSLLLLCATFPRTILAKRPLSQFMCRMCTTPTADLSGDGVALTLPSARVGYVPHSTFHGADLSSEVVRVFRPSDGRSVFAARMHAPAPTKQPIAFASGGSQIAMLDGEEIVIMRLFRSRLRASGSACWNVGFTVTSCPNAMVLDRCRPLCKAYSRRKLGGRTGV